MWQKIGNWEYLIGDHQANFFRFYGDNRAQFINLACADCVKELKNFHDHDVDMVLADLPYNKTGLHWDTLIPFEPLWKELNRVTKKNGAIALFGTEPFTSSLILSNVKFFKQKLTWLKTRPTNVFNAKKMFMNWTEDICIFYRKAPTFHPQMRTDGDFSGEKKQHTHTDRSDGIFQRTGEREGYVHKSNGGLFYPKTVLEFSNVHHGTDCKHPVQKPVKLLEYLIKTYTDPGDVVLDFCMGSGSTGVAALNTGRSFCGIELDEGYYQIAVERIREAISQMAELEVDTDAG